MGILSGLATQIDPHFNLFESAAPFAQQMIAAESGSALKVAVDQVVEIGKALIRMPRQIDRLTDLLLRGEMRFTVNETDDLIKQMDHMNRAMSRLRWTIIFMGLLLGAIGLHVSDFTTISPVVLIAAVAAWVWMILHG
jgi:predicted unusual protein kinase regulating ubiquinone biosynthesis (AarF/ABC1/UbiB family)